MVEGCGSASEVEKVKKERVRPSRVPPSWESTACLRKTQAKVDASSYVQGCAGPVTVESGTSAAEQEQPKTIGGKVDGVAK